MRLIVIGGGAAGFFCAVTAARLNPAAEVIILEKTSKLLAKVRISGGGRCNVTHACFVIADILRNYPRGEHFVKKTFHQFFTRDTIAWFAERGVVLKTEADGRMFPESDSSETVIGCLMDEARRYRVRIMLNADVKSVTRQNNSWSLLLADGKVEQADAVCIASGGYPRLHQFDWIKALGHEIHHPVPSLFTFNTPANDITRLMGISTVARVKIVGGRHQETGNVLITHWGLSGPAVLRLSARAARELAEKEYRFSVQVGWYHDSNSQDVQETIRTMRASKGARKVTGRNELGLPQRLWEFLCARAGVMEQWNWADLPATVAGRLARVLTADELTVSGKTTFKEEFVTSGGIDLSEVNPQTMESRLLPGLFFAGEVLDVDGVTGGFNFQHAWTSGWIAGKNMADFCIFAPPN